MSEAPLPFRAHPEASAGSAGDRAVERIGAQARDVRRRSNRFTAADLLFVAGGASLLGWAILILLALRLSPRGFAVAAWLVLAAALAIGWTKMRAARRTWMPSARAAIAIDHRAHLEERLATVAASNDHSRRSRLWQFLLHENLRLLPAWEAGRFVPRALPRSVWFFAIALLALVVAHRRVPHVTEGSPDSAQPVEASSPPDAEDSGDSSEAGSDPQQSSFGFDLPEAIRQAILGRQSSQSFAGKNPEKTAPVKDDRGGPAIVGAERMANGGPVRSMPGGPNAPKPSGQPGAGAKAAPAPDAKSTTEPPPVSALARGDRPKMLPPAQSGKPQNSSAKSAGKSTPGGSGGGGAGTGGDADGLYGDKQSAGKYSGSFSLDLDAMRSSDPNQSGDPGDPDVRPEARLSSDQRLDDAVRRAQVPVEYEKIVQRIFNRASDEEAAH